MKPELLRRMKTIDSAALGDDLTTRQYLSPRKPLADVLTEVAAAKGLTLAVVRDAASRTGLDVARAVGRLTRVEIATLAKRIRQAHRRHQRG